MTAGRLAGRVAVVTGGSRGIGAALAAALSKEGARVVISGRTQATVEETAERIGGIAVVADASDAQSARAPVRRAIEELGRVDILVNNVGGAAGGNPDLFEGKDSAFEETLALNLTSAFWATRAAVGAMREAGYGRLINIGSGASRTASSSPGYTAAKHGLVGLTKQLAQDLARYGITANCICPGWTNTDLVDFERMAKARGTSTAEARAWAEAENAQQRILEPAELGPLAVLLSSPEAAGITGQVIGVDGGYRL
ncbi:MAG: SDR family oxidoreductase [Deltaproteobacteria bacterium]|nr:SDR family oxidoreductase [Deltaproteobacteria bacterium]